jgi:hypothetical protein
LHLKTAAELREARTEIERLWSDAVALPLRSDADAELYRNKVDHGMNTPTFWPTDWFLKFLNPYNGQERTEVAEAVETLRVGEDSKSPSQHRHGEGNPDRHARDD